MQYKMNYILILVIFLFIGGIISFIHINSTSNKGDPISGEQKTEDKGARDDIAVPEDTSPPEKDNTTDTSKNKKDDEDAPDISYDIKPSETDSGSIPAIPAPSLERPIVFEGTFSEESKKQLTAQINEVLGLLRQDTGLFQEWLDLGSLRKVIGDHSGARDAWEYASALRPHNSLSFANVGMLYGYYLREPEKAEENLLQAIENDSKLIYLYTQTIDFYLEVLGNKEKAYELIDRGLRDNPGSTKQFEDMRAYVERSEI